MSAFFVFQNLAVLDPDGLEEYKRNVSPTVEAHGGRYRVLAGNVEPVEGDATLISPVVIEFPSVEAARSWYESPEYQPLKQLRQRSLLATGMLVEGLPASS